MNPFLAHLQPYPFQKLARLKANCLPPAEISPINLAIGEPQQPTPVFIIDAMQQALPLGLPKYPTTQGTLALRETIAQWLIQRYHLPGDSLDPEQHILPVNGTREALFALPQCLINPYANNPLVLMPNPFYQIYEGATLLAGAKPHYLNCLAEHNFQPAFDHVSPSVWRDCQLLYLCSPGNPSGTVLDFDTFKKLIALADKYDFTIAADECYSEIYADENQPPMGLLQACAKLGRTNYRRCIVFNSLSKRSSAPGLRSGFVAGDAEILRTFLQYRVYHGCSMPLPTQTASIAAWQDEIHVAESRRLYQEKFSAVIDILKPVLPVFRPPAGFYLWLETPINDEDFAQALFLQQNVTVLPGSYLSRVAEGINPGHQRIRVALVAPVETCVIAAQRIVELTHSLAT